MKEDREKFANSFTSQVENKTDPEPKQSKLVDAMDFRLSKLNFQKMCLQRVIRNSEQFIQIFVDHQALTAEKQLVEAYKFELDKVVNEIAIINALRKFTD